MESRDGIFAVAREEIYLEEIQSIDTKKSFWGLIFNFGDVVIEAAGHNVITFYRIANMKEVADTIADLSLTYTKKLGKNSKPPVEG